MKTEKPFTRGEKSTECRQVYMNGGVGKAGVPEVEEVGQDNRHGDSIQGIAMVTHPNGEAAPFRLIANSSGPSPAVCRDVVDGIRAEHAASIRELHPKYQPVGGLGLGCQMQPMGCVRRLGR